MKKAANFIKYFFFALPLIEIALFVIAGRLIGLFWTLFLVILSAIAGVWLIRNQNFAMMQRMQEAMRTGQPPPPELMGNSLTMLAGLLLIIPGFFTDIIAILLLIPYLRVRMMRILFRMPVSSANDSVVINGEYKREDNEKLPPE